MRVATMPLLPPLVDLSDPQIQGERMKACVFATRHGYFWLPCPLCGVHFGGHEWLWSEPEPVSHIPGDRPGAHTGICPWCTRAGRGWDWPL